MSRYINELTRKMDSIIQDTPISGSFLSDHATVLFNLKGSKSESSAKEVWFRKIKSINLPKYKNYLKAAVSVHYCFLSMTANFLTSSNHIFLIPQCCYADDTQLYIAFTSGNELGETAAITAMESCIADISQWMHSDKLKLNSDKTECLLIGTRKQLQKVSNI